MSPMKVTRRRFLGFSAGAVAGAAAGVPASQSLSDLVAATEEPLYPPRGREDFELSICRMCPGGCGLRVRRIEGRPVKVDGNPLHPVNGGRLCPRGQAALQGLYHPDRILQPLRRTGPRGSLESFEEASWDEALAEIGARLRLLRQVERPESLILLRGSSRGLGPRLASRFLRAFGSPNDVLLERGEEALAQALEATQGVRVAPVYDLQSTDYVLSFGAPLLEAWSSPVYMMRAYGEFRQGRPGRRGKLVQAEPRLSITGTSADEWLQIRPGSEGILALGVARVLVMEDLHDKTFTNERTLGFEDYRDPSGLQHPGLRRFLQDQFPLERIASETGVPSNVVLRIGRELAAARRQLAVGPRRGPLLPGRLFDHLAVQVLNALVGNLDAVGGLLIPEEVPLAEWPDLAPDPVAEVGRAKPRLDGAAPTRSDPERLAEALLGAAEYPFEVVLVLGADPAFASAAPDRFGRALEQVPLSVSIASLPDDTSLACDWILPQSHSLETWDLDTTPPGLPFPLASLARPVARGEGRETRPAAEVFMALAREVGGEVAAAFPWPDVETLIREEVTGLFESGRGTVMGTRFDEAWVRMMERAGWWAPGYRSADELWQRMQRTGGWWDPFYDHGFWPRVLRTPSGRFEFRVDLLTELLARRSESALLRTAATSTDSGDEEGGGRSLALLLFEPLPIAGGTGAELPFLQELLDPGHEESWETWAEIHPETARRLGIHDRDRVTVTSEEGSIEVRARVTSRVVADTVAVPVGLGKRGGGRWAAGVGANPLRLLAPTREAVSDLPDPGATRVRVSVARRGDAARARRRA